MATFALIADPHVCVPNPQTGRVAVPIPNDPAFYHESVEVLNAVVDEINAVPDLDFVLVAGDLTRESEPYNHDVARELFTRFRVPVFCVSGNHDQPRPPRLRPRKYLDPDVAPVTTPQIPALYGDFGFRDTTMTAFSCDPTPDVHLVGLCSAKPDDDCGWIGPEVLAWLDDDLTRQRDPGRETVVMLHHSIIEHVPGEAVNPTFSWFHVENAQALKALLRRHRVRLTFTGHLHIQDVKEEEGLYNIATASIASYPHAYRVMRLGNGRLEICSPRLQAIPSCPDLQRVSRQRVADAFVNVIADLLRAAPFSYAPDRAQDAAAKLRDWWPSIADGDERFAYGAEELGDTFLAEYANSFSDRPPADNNLTIELPAP